MTSVNVVDGGPRSGDLERAYFRFQGLLEAAFLFLFPSPFVHSTCPTLQSTWVSRWLVIRPRRDVLGFFVIDAVTLNPAAIRLITICLQQDRQALQI